MRYEEFAKVLENRASNMARNLTKSEETLKRRLDDLGADYKMQVPLGKYILDFVVRGRVVLEVDGASHIGREEYDAKRDKFCREMGLKVVRIPASKVHKFWLKSYVKKPKEVTDDRVLKHREKLAAKRVKRASKIVKNSFDWAESNRMNEELEDGFKRHI